MIAVIEYRPADEPEGVIHIKKAPIMFVTSAFSGLRVWKHEPLLFISITHETPGVIIPVFTMS